MEVKIQKHAMIKNIFILALIITLIILLLKYCGRGKVLGPTVTIDTVYKEVKGDTSYVLVPYAVYKPGKNILKIVAGDTIYVEDTIHVDTAMILFDYNLHRVYNDTIRNDYGYVSVTDTIAKNRIVGRGTSTRLLIPEVTKTITIHEPQKNQVYAGGGVFGNKMDPLSGFKVNVDLKTKNDQIVGLGY